MRMGEDKRKIPQAKRRTLRYNHLKHMNAAYVDVMDFLNAVLDPVEVKGGDYYLSDEDQFTILEKAFDATRTLRKEARGLRNYLAEILNEDFE